MARKIVVTSGKGGVGKTTLTANLGIALARTGARVVLADIDFGLNNLDVVMGVENKVVYDISDVLDGRCRVRQALVQDVSRKNLYVLPSNSLKASSNVTGQNVKLIMEKLNASFDFILLDCTPSLGMLTVNALAAADTTLIPVQAQYLSAKGLEQLLQTVQKVRRQINPKLKIEGILLTMTDSRTNYGQQIDNLIRGAYGSKIKVFDQTIPRSVRAAETSAVGKSIFQHDPKGKVAEAYRSLTKEVMANAEKQLKRVAERGR